VAVLTLLNLFERLLRLLHIDQADSPREGNPEHEEIMEQGRLLLQKCTPRASLGCRARVCGL
jgi:hypothetical protein